MKRNFFAGKFWVVATIVLLWQCNNGQKQTGTTIVQQSSGDTLSKLKKDTALYFTKDSVINIRFVNGDSSILVSGELKTQNQHLPVLVPVKGNSTLVATVASVDTLTNIRIDKIVLPDGSVRGPFGKEISFPVRQSGTFKIIIAHNLMAEGGLAKRFTLRVKINRQEN